MHLSVTGFVCNRSCNVHQHACANCLIVTFVQQPAPLCEERVLGTFRLFCRADAHCYFVLLCLNFFGRVKTLPNNVVALVVLQGFYLFTLEHGGTNKAVSYLRCPEIVAEAQPAV